MADVLNQAEWDLLRRDEKAMAVRSLRDRLQVSGQEAKRLLEADVHRDEMKRARARAEAATHSLDAAHDLYMEAPRFPLDGAFMKLYAAQREVTEAIELLTRGAL